MVALGGLPERGPRVHGGGVRGLPEGGGAGGPVHGRLGPGPTVTETHDPRGRARRLTEI